MRLYVFLCPVYGVWTVSTADKALYLSGFGLALATHSTHAEAFADAWARTHPKEAPDG